MSRTDDTRSPSEKLLSASLRRLANSSPREAPADLENLLTQAFRRHRRRRRTLRWVGIAVVILAISSASSWRLFVPEHRAPANQIAVGTHKPYSEPVQGGKVSINGLSLRRRVTPRPRALLAESPLLDAGKPFLALPSFALVTPEEDLRVIRVEMPVSSLRLLGARVNDDLITQRIVADLLVGADGTPYAFRLVG